MLTAMSSGGCAAATGVSVHFIEHAWRGTSEEASFAAPPLNVKTESLFVRLLPRRKRPS
jgi:hypothetical protein